MLGAPALEREVPGDPEQERAQRAAAGIELVWMAQQRHEDVLSDVFRSRRARHPPGKPVDGILVLDEGGLEVSVGHVAL
jgi:hypothetical protein